MSEIEIVEWFSTNENCESYDEEDGDNPNNDSDEESTKQGDKKLQCKIVENYRMKNNFIHVHCAMLQCLFSG